MIEEKVKDILKKYRNLEQKKDWKNQKLLGNDLKFSARDLINVYVELEKEFDIHFKEKDIVAGKFDTFDDIIKLINKEIAYKTEALKDEVQRKALEDISICIYHFMQEANIEYENFQLNSSPGILPFDKEAENSDPLENITFKE